MLSWYINVIHSLIVLYSLNLSSEYHRVGGSDGKLILLLGNIPSCTSYRYHDYEAQALTINDDVILE
jgi:hypothetical protein